MVPLTCSIYSCLKFVNTLFAVSGEYSSEERQVVPTLLLLLEHTDHSFCRRSRSGRPSFNMFSIFVVPPSWSIFACHHVGDFIDIGYDLFGTAKVPSTGHHKSRILMKASRKASAIVSNSKKMYLVFTRYADELRTKRAPGCP